MIAKRVKTHTQRWMKWKIQICVFFYVSRIQHTDTHRAHIERLEWNRTRRMDERRARVTEKQSHYTRMTFLRQTIQLFRRSLCPLHIHVVIRFCMGIQYNQRRVVFSFDRITYFMGIVYMPWSRQCRDSRYTRSTRICVVVWDTVWVEVLQHRTRIVYSIFCFFFLFSREDCGITIRYGIAYVCMR